MVSRKTRDQGSVRAASLVINLAFLGLLFLAFSPKSYSQTVAMTVDDLPYVPGDHPLNPKDAKNALRTNDRILHAFSRHHIPATGFVIELHGEQLGTPTYRRILAQWIRPGFDLGNHFYSHADVDSMSVEQTEQQILRGETTLRPLLESASREPRFMRFPYNHTGDTKEKHDAIAAFLAAHGYRMAPCTIDNSDYEFNQT